jgi:voltage-gated potassium channel Kch
MRTVFVGAGKVSIESAKGLIKKGHEVIIIESNKNKIDELSEEMDCSFLHGDGSQPKILLEANPEQADFLFCLTDNDQVNVIEGLTLPFKGILMGLFFMTLGIDLEFTYIKENIIQLSLLSLTIIFTKTLILSILGRFKHGNLKSGAYNFSSR